MLPSSLVYRLTQNPNVLLIGPGGGVDVLVAWANNAEKITAAEINPLIVDLMRNKTAILGRLVLGHPTDRRSGGPEGREFVAPARRTCTTSSSSHRWTHGPRAAAGAYSLTENYLYTLDAYKEYPAHLNPDGLLAIGRWHFEPPRAQALRLVTIGSAALKSLGCAEPSQHFLVIPRATPRRCRMKKSPFTAEEIAAVCCRLGQTRSSSPCSTRRHGGARRQSLCRLLSCDRQAGFFGSTR